jgi:hypothetical protein
MHHPSVLSAIVAAAAFFANADAAVTANGGSYAVGAAGGTIATAVPAAYTANSRPARASEWPAIKAAGGANLASGLGAAGTTAVLWDDSNGNFATVDLSNPDAAPVAVEATANNPGLLVCESANQYYLCTTP